MVQQKDNPVAWRQKFESWVTFNNIDNILVQDFEAEVKQYYSTVQLNESKSTVVKTFRIAFDNFSQFHKDYGTDCLQNVKEYVKYNNRGLYAGGVILAFYRQNDLWRKIGEEWKLSNGDVSIDLLYELYNTSPFSSFSIY